MIETNRVRRFNASIETDGSAVLHGFLEQVIVDDESGTVVGIKPGGGGAVNLRLNAGDALVDAMTTLILAHHEADQAGARAARAADQAREDAKAAADQEVADAKAAAARHAESKLAARAKSEAMP